MKNIHSKEHRFFCVKRDSVKSHIIIHAIVSFIYAAVLVGVVGVNVFVSLGAGALLFAALHFKFVFGEALKAQFKFVFLVICAFIIFALMQTTITAGLLITPIKFIFNILIILGMLSLIWAISGSIKISVTIVSVFMAVLCIVDYVMVQARSFEFQFSDFTSISTGLSVASKYSFDLDIVSYIGLAFMVAFITSIIRAKFPKHDNIIVRIGCGLSGVAVGALTVFIIYNGIFASLIGYADKYWKFRGSENNGFLVNMVYSAYATKVIKPEDYDAKKAEDDLQDYIEGYDTTVNEKVSHPNVIIIMNETFSDVQNLASEYGTQEMITDIPVTPYLDSLENSDTLKRGRALASVYGGNTANSEMEVLTGLSMQFVPRNTVCYNLYLNQTNTFSIVDLYNKAGYLTIGMHPEDPTNWRRNIIYPMLGFQNTYFMEDFDTSQEDDIFRDHVSDSATYRKIEELYESKGDKPLFLFAVTMQNHGGYSTMGFDYTVDIEGYSKYKGVREYLTCINNSDTALQGLIEYFENVEEETIILFFGDHQPSLSSIASKFYGLTDDSTTEEEQLKYIVPYIYWSNYDTSDTEVRDFVSLNFLSTYLLEMTGIESNDYFNFVSKVSTEIEAMNANGYFDMSHTFHETSYQNQNYNETLDLYSRVQYNVMFDMKDKLNHLFGINK